MKNTGRGKKKNSFRDFSQSVLLDIQYLSCKYFPHSSTIASNRKYCRTFIEYTYSGAKSDVPASPENSHDQSSFRFRSLLFSLLYLSYLIFSLFALSHSIRFPSLPSSILRFCLLSSASPPLPRERRTSLKSFLHLSVSHAGRNADNHLAHTDFFALSIFSIRRDAARQRVAKIPRGKYLARSLARGVSRSIDRSKILVPGRVVSRERGSTMLSRIPEALSVAHSLTRGRLKLPDRCNTLSRAITPNGVHRDGSRDRELFFPSARGYWHCDDDDVDDVDNDDRTRNAHGRPSAAISS